MGKQSTPSSEAHFSSQTSAYWLPPLFSGGLAVVGEWAQGWYHHTKETVRCTLTGPEEPFFVKAQENKHFIRFQMWRHELERDLRAIRSAVLFGELNAIELGERLLAVQGPENIADHILSPVMYSRLLSQFEQGLRRHARANIVTEEANPQELTLTADVIQEVLHQLRADLNADSELTEEYFASDLFNAIILYSGDRISRAGLLTVLNYYQSLIDDTLHEPLVSLIKTLPENATDPNNPFEFFRSNRLIRTLIQNIQSVFEGYYESLALEDIANDSAEAQFGTCVPSYSQRFSALFEVAWDLTLRGIRYVQENPRTAMTTMGSAVALGYLYYSSSRDAAEPPSELTGMTSYSSWDNLPTLAPQSINLLCNAGLACGLNIIAGNPGFTAPSAVIAGMLSFVQLAASQSITAALATTSPIATAASNTEVAAATATDTTFPNTETVAAATTSPIATAASNTEVTAATATDITFSNTETVAAATTSPIATAASNTEVTAATAVTDIRVSNTGTVNAATIASDTLITSPSLTATRTIVTRMQQTFTAATVTRPSLTAVTRTRPTATIATHTQTRPSVTDTTHTVTRTQLVTIPIDTQTRLSLTQAATSPAITHITQQQPSITATTVTRTQSQPTATRATHTKTKPSVTATKATITQTQPSITTNEPTITHTRRSLAASNPARTQTGQRLTLTTATSISTQTRPTATDTTGFFKTLGDNNFGGGAEVLVTQDNGYIVLGITSSFTNHSDILLVKFNNVNTLLWAKTYGGNEDDSGSFIQQKNDSSYIATGSTYSFGAGGMDFLLVKFDDNGEVLWAKTLGGSNSDYGTCVQSTNDDSYIAAGCTSSFGARWGDLLVVKCDNNGALTWVKTLGGDNAVGVSLSTTIDNGFVITGWSQDYGPGTVDIFLIKFNISGHILWAKNFYSGSNSWVYCVKQTIDNGFVITGFLDSINGLFLAKFDVNGSLDWANRLNFGGRNFGSAVQQTVDHGFVIAGSRESSSAFLVKCDNDGNLTWARSFGVVASAPSIQQTGKGGYLVTGSTTGFGFGNNIYLAMFDIDGNIPNCGTVITEIPIISIITPDVTSIVVTSQPIPASVTTWNITEIGRTIDIRTHCAYFPPSTAITQTQPSVTVSIPTWTQTHPSKTVTQATISQTEPSLIATLVTHTPQSVTDSILTRTQTHLSKTATKGTLTQARPCVTTTTPIITHTRQSLAASILTSTHMHRSFVGTNLVRTQTRPTTISENAIYSEQSSESSSSNLRLILAIIFGVAGSCSSGVCIFLSYLFFRNRHTQKEPTHSVELDSIHIEPEDQASPPAKRKRRGKKDDGFCMSPTVKERRKEIGGQYYMLSKITREEARAIEQQSGLVIPFPEGKQRIRYILGKGNFGAIKLAQRIEDGEYVVAKKVKGEMEMAESKAEAYLQKEAAGPNVLPIHNTTELEDALYHFMPLAGLGNGRDMQALLANADKKVKQLLLTFIAKDILNGLLTCHKKGIFHLDIKPENIVFTGGGNGYITDFGCAKRAERTKPLVPHDSIGDNRYFPPERYQATWDGTPFRASKADFWSAGLTLLEIMMNEELCHLIDMPASIEERFSRCNADFFGQQFARIRELRDPAEGSIYAVVMGLLEPNPKRRLAARDALQAECFRQIQSVDREALLAVLKLTLDVTQPISDGSDQAAAAAAGYKPAPGKYSHKKHSPYYQKMSLEFTQRSVEKRAQSKSERSKEAGQQESMADLQSSATTEQHLMDAPLQVYSSEAHREHYVELDPSRLKDKASEYGSHLYFADKKQKAKEKTAGESQQEHEYGSPLFFADRKQEAIRASQAIEQKHHNQSNSDERYSDSEETQEMLRPV